MPNVTKKALGVFEVIRLDMRTTVTTDHLWEVNIISYNE